MAAAFITGESAVHSPYARSLLPPDSPPPAAAAPAAAAQAAGGARGAVAEPPMPASFLTALAVDLDSRMCRAPAVAISGQVGVCVCAARHIPAAPGRLPQASVDISPVCVGHL